MIKLDHYGVEGSGKTLKEAKADAGRQITEMLKGDYVPEILAYKKMVCLVWREPYGWYSKLITDYRTGEIETGRASGCASHSLRAEAILSARMQLAQTSWTAADGLALPEILTPDQYREFVSWARFQLKYQELKATGLTDGECHQGACDAMWS